MTSKDNAQDEELLARYRRASEKDAAAPSESVRNAILAESRRVADELKPKTSFDVSRPAANDARWKITAYGTFGAALLAALLIAPRFWESRRATEVSSAPAAPTAAPVPSTAASDAAAPAAPAATTPASDAAAPAAKLASSNAAAPAPKMESIEPSNPGESLQEVIVTQATHKASLASAEKSRRDSVPAPSNPPSVEHYAGAPASPPPVANSAAPLAAPAPIAAPAPLAYSARAAQGGVLSMNADRAARTSLVQTPASLQAAAGLGDVRQTALLLDQGVAVDARDEAGRTPLMLAVAQGRLEVVRLLLARGADPNAADNAGRTPLQQARDRNLRDVAALLERAGAH